MLGGESVLNACSKNVLGLASKDVNYKSCFEKNMETFYVFKICFR